MKLGRPETPRLALTPVIPGHPLMIVLSSKPQAAHLPIKLASMDGGVDKPGKRG